MFIYMTNWTIFVLAFLLLNIASFKFLPRLYKSFKLLPLTPLALWQVKVKILGWKICKIKSNSKKLTTLLSLWLMKSFSCLRVASLRSRSSSLETRRRRLASRDSSEWPIPLSTTAFTDDQFKDHSLTQVFLM